VKRILFVEDSVTSQKIFGRMFSPPHDVVIVTSPRAANERLALGNFDLVVSDFLFPQGDAFDVLTPLRRRHAPTALPFIAVSGSMDEALRAHLLAAGANACAAKPIHTPAFRTLVEAMLARPFVETDDSGVVNACCFQWVAGGECHEYCPETGDFVSGADRAEVSARMQALLRERRAEGVLTGRVMQERTRTYVLRSAPEPASAGA
jgi:CheY-like chemotaxis protein